jgi:hypothetical protein
MRNLEPDGVRWARLLRAFLNNIKSQHERRVRAERRSKHPQFLGRCRKDEARDLRVWLRIIGVQVVLYPRGETQKPRGMKRHRSLCHTDDCAVYAKNCSAQDVLDMVRSTENSIFSIPRATWKIGTTD